MVIRIWYKILHLFRSLVRVVMISVPYDVPSPTSFVGDKMHLLLLMFISYRDNISLLVEKRERETIIEWIIAKS